MLRRLFSYWQTAKRQTIVGGILLVVAAAIDLLQPWPIKWLVDYVFGSLTPPAWLGSMLPVLADDNMAGGLMAVCISILVLALLHRSAATFGHFFLIRAGAQIVQQLRCHACDHLHRLSLAFHDRTKVGDSLYRVAYDSHAAQSLLNAALVPVATATLVLVGATIIMFRMNAPLTVATLAIAPLFFFTIRGFSRRLDEETRRYHENESTLVSTVQESL